VESPPAPALLRSGQGIRAEREPARGLQRVELQELEGGRAWVVVEALDGAVLSVQADCDMQGRKRRMSERDKERGSVREGEREGV
jgi:hypothetical protein